MDLPDYWLPQPPTDFNSATARAFERLAETTLARGDNAFIEYTPAAPKWQFLCYLAERHGVVLHGSGNPHIAQFEPRQSADLHAFGKQKAVYAAGDGIWPMFFAIVDRDRRVQSVANACVRLVDAEGRVRGPFYVFSISRTALPQQPWREGVVYLLPPATFVAQPPLSFGPYTAQIPQVASPVPVTPLARLAVGPQDFPFLAQIRGHDDARLAAYADAMQTGAPWPDP